MQFSLGSPGVSRLERRAEATTYQVDDLLAELKDGKLRMPHFQRGMKWQDQDRLDLFDSLYRGFPVGTLLFWKHDVGAGEVRFGHLTLQAQGRADGFLIVDGQQRVTTLASTLLATRKAGDREMLFDLNNESFHYGRLRESAPMLPGPGSSSKAIPVQELFDSSRLIQWLARRTDDLSPSFVGRALECGKRLREYRIPVYIVDTKDEDVLRTIFDRTNRTGRSLDDADVFTALYATVTPQNDDAEVSLEQVARRVATIGVGKLDDDTVLKSLRAVCDLPVDRDFTKSLSRGEVPEALSRTEAALVRVVHFLREDAGIPHVALCPYELPIVVLARFFDAFPEPRIRNRMLLRRWLWRGSLGGTLRGVPVSLRQYVDAVARSDESKAVEDLLALTTSAAPSMELSLSAFNFATARTKLAVCALAALLPRDLRTGEPIDVATMFSERSPTLPRIVEPSDELSRSVVNRLLHPRISSKELLSALVSAPPYVVASHGISTEAQSALAESNVARFLELRRGALRERLGEFFRRQAEIGADDSPPLDSITVEEDS